MQGPSGPARWLVLAAALLASLIVARFALGPVVGDSCVWAGGADGRATESYLRDWLARHHGPTLNRWGVSVDPHTATLDLVTDAGNYRIALRLNSLCWTPPAVQLLRAPGDFPSGTQLADLAAAFPVPKHGASATDAAIVAMILMGACLGVAMAAVAPSTDAVYGAAVRHAAWVLPLLVLAAWPLLFAPFDTDAPAERAAFAAVDAFGDWNHPFLPYLFNRPTTWLSLEPWALRLVPFGFLCLQTVLMMVAANRDGGRLAAALAGTWFVCEVRRRHGLYDLSDWDVAGTFLIAMLITVQRRTRIGWRDAMVLSVLMAGGVFSSWLMIIAASSLLACLGSEARRRPGPILLVAAVFVVLGVFALRIFALGSGALPLFTSETLGRQMYAETPVGRSLVMAVPVALAAVWLVAHRQQIAVRFVALTLIAVPLAVYAAQVRSHVNGGYYVGLCTPLLIYAAAVATARLIDAIAARFAPRRGSWASPVALRGLLAVAVAVATIRGLGTGRMGTGAEALQVLANDTRTDGLPIFTNAPGLVHLLAFERARAGAGAIADAIGPRADVIAPDAVAADTPDLQRRIRLLPAGQCAPPAATTGFYLVYLASDERDMYRACVEQLAARCRPLMPGMATVELQNWVLHCDLPAPSAGD